MVPELACSCFRTTAIVKSAVRFIWSTARWKTVIGRTRFRSPPDKWYTLWCWYSCVTETPWDWDKFVCKLSASSRSMPGSNAPPCPGASSSRMVRWSSAAASNRGGGCGGAWTHPQDVSRAFQRCLFMAELHESRLPVPQPVGLLTIEILHVEHHHSSTAPGLAARVLGPVVFLLFISWLDFTRRSLLLLLGYVLYVGVDWGRFLLFFSFYSFANPGLFVVLRLLRCQNLLGWVFFICTNCSFSLLLSSFRLSKLLV